jgi:hypothetical protein
MDCELREFTLVGSISRAMGLVDALIGPPFGPKRFLFPEGRVEIVRCKINDIVVDQRRLWHELKITAMYYRSETIKQSFSWKRKPVEWLIGVESESDEMLIRTYW